MARMEGLRVVHSDIHGYGVATTRRFSAGELVMYGDGILFLEDDEFDDEYALIVPRWDENGQELPSVYWDLTCQSRWINHSCDPNSEVDTELTLARVFVDLLSPDRDRATVLAGLRSAAGVVRRELQGRVQLRRIPELRFEFDESIQRGLRIETILSEIATPPVAPKSDEDSGGEDEGGEGDGD